MNFFVKLYFIVPIILIIVTVFLTINGKNKLNNYNKCEGTIIRFYENSSELRVDSYESKAISPVVSYTVDGKTYEFIGNYYSTTMKVGQKVDVLYDKNDCSKATIKGGILLAPIITGGLAILFTLPIIIYFILKGKGLINF